MRILFSKKTSSKLIAIVMAGLLVWETGVWAAPAPLRDVLSKSYMVQRDGIEIPIQVQIPSNLGKVTEVFNAARITNDAVLVHIEDAHGEPEAQKNSQAILEHLKKEYGIQTFFLEGAWSKLEPSLLRFSNSVEENQKILSELTEKGIVGGPENFLYGNSRHSVQGTEYSDEVAGYGIEDLDLYKKNLEQFRTVIGAKAETDRFLEEMKAGLLTKASQVLNPELADYFRQWSFQEEVQTDYAAHLRALAEQAQKHLGLDLSDAREQYDWPMLVRFFKLKELEKYSAQSTAHSEEKKRLKVWLQNKNLILSEQVDLILSDEVRGTNYDVRSFFENFYEKAAPLGFKFKDYPALSKEWGKQILAQELDIQILMKEITTLENQLLEKLAQTEDEKKFIQKYREYLLMKKLLNLELSRDEWRGISPESGVRRFENAESVVGGRVSGLGTEIEATIQKAQDFYSTAEARDAAMISRTLDWIKKEKIEKAAIITGGFHSQGLGELLKEKNISYVRVQPHITQIHGRENYMKLMTGRSSLRYFSPAEPALTIEMRADLAGAGMPRVLARTDENKEAVYLRRDQFEIIRKGDMARLVKVAEQSNRIKIRLAGIKGRPLFDDLEYLLLDHSTAEWLEGESLPREKKMAYLESEDTGKIFPVSFSMLEDGEWTYRDFSRSEARNDWDSAVREVFEDQYGFYRKTRLIKAWNLAMRSRMFRQKLDNAETVAAIQGAIEARQKQLEARFQFMLWISGLAALAFEIMRRNETAMGFLDANPKLVVALFVSGAVYASAFILKMFLLPKQEEDLDFLSQELQRHAREIKNKAQINRSESRVLRTKEEKQALYLDAYRITAGHLARMARIVNVHREQLYRWRDKLSTEQIKLLPQLEKYGKNLRRAYVIRRGDEEAIALGLGVSLEQARKDIRLMLQGEPRLKTILKWAKLYDRTIGHRLNKQPEFHSSKLAANLAKVDQAALYRGLSEFGVIQKRRSEMRIDSEDFFNVLRSKAGTRVFFEGGPLLQPQLAAVFDADEAVRKSASLQSEANFQDHTAPDWLIKKISAENFFRDYVSGSMPSEIVFKPNAGSLGERVAFLSLAANEIKIRLAHTSDEVDKPDSYPSQINAVFRRFDLQGLSHFRYWRNEDLAEFSLPKDHPRAVEILTEVWKILSVQETMSQSNYDPGMVEKRIDFIKANGKSLETRVIFNYDLETDELVLDEEWSSDGYGTFTKVGSSAFFANQAFRLSAYEKLGDEAYDEVLRAVGAALSERDNFKTYFRDQLMSAMRFSKTRFLEAGFPADLKVEFSMDFQWLPPEAGAVFPRPVLIESDMRLFTPLSKGAAEMVQPFSHRSEMRGLLASFAFPREYSSELQYRIAIQANELDASKEKKRVEIKVFAAPPGIDVGNEVNAGQLQTIGTHIIEGLTQKTNLEQVIMVLSGILMQDLERVLRKNADQAITIDQDIAPHVNRILAEKAGIFMVAAGLKVAPLHPDDLSTHLAVKTFDYDGYSVSNMNGFFAAGKEAQKLILGMLEEGTPRLLKVMHPIVSVNIDPWHTIQVIKMGGQLFVYDPSHADVYYPLVLSKGDEIVAITKDGLVHGWFNWQPSDLFKSHVTVNGPVKMKSVAWSSTRKFNPVESDMRTMRKFLDEKNADEILRIIEISNGKIMEDESDEKYLRDLRAKNRLPLVQGDDLDDDWAGSVHGRASWIWDARYPKVNIFSGHLSDSKADVRYFLGEWSLDAAAKKISGFLDIDENVLRAELASLKTIGKMPRWLDAKVRIGDEFKTSSGLQGLLMTALLENNPVHDAAFIERFNAMNYQGGATAKQILEMAHHEFSARSEMRKFDSPLEVSREEFSRMWLEQNSASLETQTPYGAKEWHKDNLLTGAELKAESGVLRVLFHKTIFQSSVYQLWYLKEGRDDWQRIDQEVIGLNSAEDAGLGLSVILNNDSLFVSRLFLQESFRGQGWGQLILNWIRNYAEHKNIKRINFETRVPTVLHLIGEVFDLNEKDEKITFYSDSLGRMNARDYLERIGANLLIAGLKMDLSNWRQSEIEVASAGKINLDAHGEAFFKTENGGEYKIKIENGWSVRLWLKEGDDWKEQSFRYPEPVNVVISLSERSEMRTAAPAKKMSKNEIINFIRARDPTRVVPRGFYDAKLVKRISGAEVNLRLDKADVRDGQQKNWSLKVSAQALAEQIEKYGASALQRPVVLVFQDDQNHGTVLHIFDQEEYQEDASAESLSSFMFIEGEFKQVHLGVMDLAKYIGINLFDFKKMQPLPRRAQLKPFRNGHIARLSGDGAYELLKNKAVDLTLDVDAKPGDKIYGQLVDDADFGVIIQVVTDKGQVLADYARLSFDLDKKQIFQRAAGKPMKLDLNALRMIAYAQGFKGVNGQPILPVEFQSSSQVLPDHFMVYAEDSRAATIAAAGRTPDEIPPKLKIPSLLRARSKSPKIIPLSLKGEHYLRVVDPDTEEDLYLLGVNQGNWEPLVDLTAIAQYAAIANDDQQIESTLESTSPESVRHRGLVLGWLIKLVLHPQLFENGRFGILRIKRSLWNQKNISDYFIQLLKNYPKHHAAIYRLMARMVHAFPANQNEVAQNVALFELLRAMPMDNQEFVTDVAAALFAYTQYEGVGKEKIRQSAHLFLEALPETFKQQPYLAKKEGEKYTFNTAVLELVRRAYHEFSNYTRALQASFEQKGNWSLIRFVTAWNKKDFVSPIFIPNAYLWKDKSKNRYSSPEQVRAILRERTERGLDNSSTGLRQPMTEDGRGGDGTLLNFIKAWNRAHPDQKIELEDRREQPQESMAWLDWWRRHVSQIKKLTPDEQLDFYLQWKTEGDERAYQRLFESYVPLIDDLARDAIASDESKSAEHYYQGLVMAGVDVLVPILAEVDAENSASLSRIKLTIQYEMFLRLAELDKKTGSYSLNAPAWDDSRSRTTMGETISGGLHTSAGYDFADWRSGLISAAMRRDQALDAPVISYQEKVRIAQELGQVIHAYQFQEDAKKIPFAIYLSGDLSALAPSLRGLAGIKFTVLVNSQNRSQIEALHEQLHHLLTPALQKLAAKYHFVIPDTEPVLSILTPIIDSETIESLDHLQLDVELNGVFVYEKQPGFSETFFEDVQNNFPGGAESYRAYVVDRLETSLLSYQDLVLDAKKMRSEMRQTEPPKFKNLVGNGKGLGFLPFLRAWEFIYRSFKAWTTFRKKPWPIQIEGYENLWTTDKLILAGNHTGLAENLFFVTELYRLAGRMPFFIAQPEHVDALTRKLIQMGGGLPIEKGKTVAKAKEFLKSNPGSILGIFPSGRPERIHEKIKTAAVAKKSTEEIAHDFLHWQESAVAKIAIETGVAVVPFAIDSNVPRKWGVKELWHAFRLWEKNDPRQPPFYIRVRIGKPISSKDQTPEALMYSVKLAVVGELRKATEEAKFNPTLWIDGYLRKFPEILATQPASKKWSDFKVVEFFHAQMLKNFSHEPNWAARFVDATALKSPWFQKLSSEHQKLIRLYRTYLKLHHDDLNYFESLFNISVSRRHFMSLLSGVFVTATASGLTQMPAIASQQAVPSSFYRGLGGMARTIAAEQSRVIAFGQSTVFEWATEHLGLNDAFERWGKQNSGLMEQLWSMVRKEEKRIADNDVLVQARVYEILSSVLSGSDMGRSYAVMELPAYERLRGRIFESAESLLERLNHGVEIFKSFSPQARRGIMLQLGKSPSVGPGMSSAEAQRQRINKTKTELQQKLQKKQAQFYTLIDSIARYVFESANPDAAVRIKLEKAIADYEAEIIKLKKQIDGDLRDLADQEASLEVSQKILAQIQPYLHAYRERTLFAARSELRAQNLEQGLTMLDDLVRDRLQNQAKPFVIVNLFGGAAMGTSTIGKIIAKRGVAGLPPEKVKVLEGDDFYDENLSTPFPITWDQRLKPFDYVDALDDAQEQGVRVVVVTGIFSEFLSREVINRKNAPMLAELQDDLDHRLIVELEVQTDVQATRLYARGQTEALGFFVGSRMFEIKADSQLYQPDLVIENSAPLTEAHRAFLNRSEERKPGTPEYVSIWAEKLSTKQLQAARLFPEIVRAKWPNIRIKVLVDSESQAVVQEFFSGVQGIEISLIPDSKEMRSVKNPLNDFTLTFNAPQNDWIPANALQLPLFMTNEPHKYLVVTVPVDDAENLKKFGLAEKPIVYANIHAGEHSLAVESIVKLHQDWRNRGEKTAQIVYAPRYLNLIGELELGQMKIDFERAGISYALRSDLKASGAQFHGDVLIWDTEGELSELLKSAKLSVYGSTLSPNPAITTSHNFAESYGPVITGHISDAEYRGIAANFPSSFGAFVFKSFDALQLLGVDVTSAHLANAVAELNRNDALRAKYSAANEKARKALFDYAVKEIARELDAWEQVQLALDAKEDTRRSETRDQTLGLGASGGEFAMRSEHRYVEVDPTEKAKVFNEIKQNTENNLLRFLERLKLGLELVEPRSHDEVAQRLKAEIDRLIQPDRVFHSLVVKDEQGVYWILKKRERNARVAFLEARSEKNFPERERLAYLIAQNKAPLAEIRIPAINEIKDLPGAQEENLSDYYLTRVVTDENIPSIKWSAGEAASRLFVAYVLLRKWDPHLLNHAFVKGVPMAIDHDAMLGRFDANDPILDFLKFVSSFLNHYVNKSLYAVVSGLDTVYGDDLKSIKKASENFSKNNPVTALRLVISIYQSMLDHFNLGSQLIDAWGLNPAVMRQAVEEFQSIKNIRDMAVEAGYAGNDLESVVAYFDENQSNLKRDVSSVWKLVSGLWLYSGYEDEYEHLFSLSSRSEMREGDMRGKHDRPADILVRSFMESLGGDNPVAWKKALVEYGSITALAAAVGVSNNPIRKYLSKHGLLKKMSHKRMTQHKTLMQRIQSAYVITEGDQTATGQMVGLSQATIFHHIQNNLTSAQLATLKQQAARRKNLRKWYVIEQGDVAVIAKRMKTNEAEITKLIRDWQIATDPEINKVFRWVRAYLAEDRNTHAAARRLKIPQGTLYSVLERYEIFKYLPTTRTGSSASRGKKNARSEMRENLEVVGLGKIIDIEAVASFFEQGYWIEFPPTETGGMIHIRNTDAAKFPGGSPGSFMATRAGDAISLGQVFPNLPARQGLGRTFIALSLMMYFGGEKSFTVRSHYSHNALRDSLMKLSRRGGFQFGARQVNGTYSNVTGTMPIIPDSVIKTLLDLNHANRRSEMREVKVSPEAAAGYRAVDFYKTLFEIQEWNQRYSEITDQDGRGILDQKYEDLSDELELKLAEIRGRDNAETAQLNLVDETKIEALSVFAREQATAFKEKIGAMEKISRDERDRFTKEFHEALLIQKKKLKAELLLLKNRLQDPFHHRTKYPLIAYSIIRGYSQIAQLHRWHHAFTNEAERSPRFKTLSSAGDLVYTLDYSGQPAFKIVTQGGKTQVYQMVWKYRDVKGGARILMPGLVPLEHDRLDKAYRGRLHTLESQERDFAQLVYHELALTDLSDEIAATRRRGELDQSETARWLAVIQDVAEGPDGKGGLKNKNTKLLDKGQPVPMPKESLKMAEDALTRLADSQNLTHLETAQIGVNHALTWVRLRLPDIRKKKKGVVRKRDYLFHQIRTRDIRQTLGDLNVLFAKSPEPALEEVAALREKVEELDQTYFRFVVDHSVYYHAQKNIKLLIASLRGLEAILRRPHSSQALQAQVTGIETRSARELNQNLNRWHQPARSEARYFEEPQDRQFISENGFARAYSVPEEKLTEVLQSAIETLPSHDLFEELIWIGKRKSDSSWDLAIGFRRSSGQDYPSHAALADRAFGLKRQEVASGVLKFAMNRGRAYEAQILTSPNRTHPSQQREELMLWWGVVAQISNDINQAIQIRDESMAHALFSKAVLNRVKKQDKAGKYYLLTDLLEELKRQKRVDDEKAMKIESISLAAPMDGFSLISDAEASSLAWLVIYNSARDHFLKAAFKKIDSTHPLIVFVSSEDLKTNLLRWFEENKPAQKLFIYVSGKTISSWARDRVLPIVTPQGPKIILPKLRPSSQDGPRGAALEAARAYFESVGIPVEQSQVIFEGGNILFNGETALFGANLIEQNQVHNGWMSARIKKEIAKVLVGARQIYSVTDPFNFHLDMFMTLLPERKIVIGDPALGLAALENDTDQGKVANLYSWHQDDLDTVQRVSLKITRHLTRKYQPRVEALIANLEKLGFDIVRVPLVLGRESNQRQSVFPLVTYNNALIEGNRVLMPWYGIQADLSAKQAFEKLGYEVEPLEDATAAMVDFGCARCMFQKMGMGNKESEILEGFEKAARSEMREELMPQGSKRFFDEQNRWVKTEDRNGNLVDEIVWIDNQIKKIRTRNSDGTFIVLESDYDGLVHWAKTEGESAFLGFEPGLNLNSVKSIPYAELTLRSLAPKGSSPAIFRVLSLLMRDQNIGAVRYLGNPSSGDSIPSARLFNSLLETMEPQAEADLQDVVDLGTRSDFGAFNQDKTIESYTPIRAKFHMQPEKVEWRSSPFERIFFETNKGLASIDVRDGKIQRIYYDRKIYLDPNYLVSSVDFSALRKTIKYENGEFKAYFEDDHVLTVNTEGKVSFERSEARVNTQDSSDASNNRTAEISQGIFSIEFVTSMSRTEFRLFFDRVFPDLAANRQKRLRDMALSKAGISLSINEGLIVGADLTAREGFWDAAKLLFDGQKVAILGTGQSPLANIRFFEDVPSAKKWLNAKKITAWVSPDEAIEHAELKREVSDWVIMTNQRLAKLYSALGLEAFAQKLMISREFLRAA